ncbi:MAG: endolytic transglycosylase MltG [Alistipes sp.]
MRRKLLLVCLSVVVLLLCSGLYAHNRFYGNCVKTESHLYLPSSTTYERLTDSLMPRIKHRSAFRAYATRIDLKRTFKSGHYLLKPGMSVIEVARMLKLGMQTPVKVIINNVRIPAQLAAKLARQLDADSTAFAEALSSPTLAKEMGFDSLTYFSMFIPDTYEFYWTVTPEAFVKRMHVEYDRFWTKNRDEARQRSGLSRLEVMTLASIVSEETRQRDEMPRIAGVYINRLRCGMPLQADPTIKYALQDFGLKRILYVHLKYPSPYNTYINKGLPPSPICMPERDVIDAVLNFEQHDYFFFCARPTFDGYHNFARNYAEHQVNARTYSAAMDARKVK